MRRLGAWVLPLVVACGPASTPARDPSPSASASTVAVATSAAPPAPAPKPKLLAMPETCKLPWTTEPVWSPTDPSVGPLTARVTIVWFFELDDPFSARVAPTIADLRDELGHDHVRIVWKHHPLGFHATAKPAAKVAQLVFAQQGGEAFFRFIRSAFDQKPPHTDDKLFELASRVGVTSRADVDAALADPAMDEVFSATEGFAADLEMRGVPTFLVNGVPVSGAQPIERFRDLARKANLTARQEEIDACVATQRELPNRLAKDREDTAPREDAAFVAVPLGSSPGRGAAQPLVTIVAFGGYQDPFSRRATSTIKTLLEKHKDDLRYVWKDFPLPFHPHAVHSAVIARSALTRSGVETFWKVHDDLMSQSTIDEPTLQKVGQKFGLAVPPSKSKPKNAAIDEDTDLGTRVGVNGTPAFYVNGQKLSGAQPLETFERVVKEELAKAKKLVAGGTPRAAVYEAALKANKASPPKTKTK